MGDLYETYSAEIDDLFSDSEGKVVIQQRLNDRRSQFGALLPTMACNPEMGAACFFGAFRFTSTEGVRAAMRADPEEDNFPTWSELEKTMNVGAWAMPLVHTALTDASGDRFLVSAACLEYLRLRDKVDLTRTEGEQAKADAGEEDRDDGAPDDLAEAGNDWLSNQGFDSIK